MRNREIRRMTKPLLNDVSIVEKKLVGTVNFVNNLFQKNKAFISFWQGINFRERGTLLSRMFTVIITSQFLFEIYFGVLN